jgi:DNA polymerase-3 subunit epsilon
MKKEPLRCIEPINLTGAVILDTETTGLGSIAEVIEISIINAETGAVLIDTLIKPVFSCSGGAFAVHGITEAMLASAPEWPAVHDQVTAILTSRTVIIYNSAYDLRILRQTAMHHGLEPIAPLKSICAMLWYAEYFGDWDNYRQSYAWQKLIYAADAEQVQDHGAHRAMADCMTTRDVIMSVNSKLPDINAALNLALKRKQRRHDVLAAREQTLHKNTVIVSRERIKNTRLPAGFYTRTRIIKKKLEGQQWQIVGQTTQQGAPLYDIFLPGHPLTMP